MFRTEQIAAREMETDALYTNLAVCVQKVIAQKL
jgi:hypothetical protein